MKKIEKNSKKKINMSLDKEMFWEVYDSLMGNIGALKLDYVTNNEGDADKKQVTFDYRTKHIETTVTIYSKCSIRQDLLNKELSVPIGEIYYSEPTPLPYRWLEDNKGFQVKHNNEWLDAESIDWDF